MRAESHQASVLRIPFVFNLEEIPGKLQPLSSGGGGLASVRERAAGTGEPHRP